jgi:hypothetical protein
VDLQATAKSAASAAPRLREASFDDYPKIALLQAEHGMGVRSREEWQHLWGDNPAYVDLQGKWPIGWVLEAGCDIVGYFGNIPVLYELNGKRLIAGCGHSWVVASVYRGYSILLLDQFLRQKNADLCLSTTVNLASYNAHVALGALPVPVGAWDRSSVWITTYTSFVASWLARKKCPLASGLSYPISIALFARDAVINRRLLKRSNGNLNPNIKCYDTFDERFDAFWDTLRAENPNTLLAVRSRQVLEWHFRYALRENRLWIVTVGAGSCICAYAIFLLKRKSPQALKRMMFVDFEATRDKTTLCYPLLLWALDRCRRESIHLLEAPGLRPKGVGDIGMLAPYNIQQEAGSYLYKAGDRTLAGMLNDPDVWAPSLFDSDASF